MFECTQVGLSLFAHSIPQFTAIANACLMAALLAVNFSQQPCVGPGSLFPCVFPSISWCFLVEVVVSITGARQHMAGCFGSRSLFLCAKPRMKNKTLCQHALCSGQHRWSASLLFFCIALMKMRMRMRMCMYMFRSCLPCTGSTFFIFGEWMKPGSVEP